MKLDKNKCLKLLKERKSLQKEVKLLKDYDYVLRQKNTFCGDEITISIKSKSKKVYKIGYKCKSCIYTQASARLLSEFFKNKWLSAVPNLLGKL